MPAQKDDTAANTNEAANGDGANGGENTLTPEQTARIEEIRGILTDRKVDFKETDTLEELEETLKLSDEAIAKAEAKKDKKEDKKEDKKQKAPEERILDRRTKRLQDKADREDTIPVFCTHGTSYGPRMVVVDMPRVDAKAFGDSVTETKLKVGTRVDKHGKALKDGQLLDEEDEAYTPRDEE